MLALHRHATSIACLAGTQSCGWTGFFFYIVIILLASLAVMWALVLGCCCWRQQRRRDAAKAPAEQLERGAPVVPEAMRQPPGRAADTATMDPEPQVVLLLES